MDQDHNGFVTEAEFVKNCLKNKSLLFPAVRYQLDLRGRILSHPFWTKREGKGSTLLRELITVRNKLHPRAYKNQGTSLSTAMASSVKETEEGKS